MKNKRILPLCLIAALLLAATLLTGCQGSSEEGPGILPGILPGNEAEVTEVPTDAPTEPPTEAPTEPPPTCPPDGDPDDVTCKGSYTGGTLDVTSVDQEVVATIGEAEMNNALLQIYYRMAVNTYREAGHEIAPDFSMPLDVQLCPLEGTAITWQQYFLDQALNSWRSYYAMVQRSKTAVLPLEEAYDRDEKEHEKHQIENIYNLGHLYGYNTDYEIAEAHQAYLDELPNLLEELAAANDCPTPAALASRFAGLGTNDTYLLEYAQLLNEGYMYAATLSYYMEPKAEEVEAYFTQNETAYAQQGITKDSVYLNLRQILLVPEGAVIAADGTVTASEDSWDDCRQEAEKLLKKYNSDKTEDNFANLAFANSDDTGSSVNGGLYTNLSKGQLMEELDLWCFDAARKVGDTVIIRTSLGYHILYISQSTKAWYEQAEKDLIAQMVEDEITQAVADYPMTVDYSKILLGEPTGDLLLSTGDLLYPDIAHERFPQAPLYFQQDYPETMYGNYPLVRYGCGVTTMAMLVSYMTDEEWTPPELCALYGSYCGPKGTAHAMFLDVPADNNFYCVERVYTWKEAKRYMEDGYMVVTLQNGGYWTNGGHYLLLHNLIDVETEVENEKGETETVTETRVQVWDSNVKNYKKLKGHVSGSFALTTIPGNAKCYWVYQKKVMNVDSCARCAEPTEESHFPTSLFTQDYICDKCRTAVNRRDAYIDGSALIRSYVVEITLETPTEAVTEAPTETATEAPTE